MTDPDAVFAIGAFDVRGFEAFRDNEDSEDDRDDDDEHSAISN